VRKQDAFLLSAGAMEVDPELQTLVSAMIAGPVGPGDEIGSI
jgi:hypothetical protein